MENITLNVDEKILAAARRYATEHGCTVNDMVRDFLTDIASRKDRTVRTRIRIKQLSLKSKARIGTETWKRGDLHKC